MENPNFFVFHPICLKFGTGGNFEMLITKGKPKLKLENDLNKKIAVFYRFQPKLYQALFNNGIVMAKHVRVRAGPPISGAMVGHWRCHLLFQRPEVSASKSV